MQLLFLLLIVCGALAIPVEETHPSLDGAKVFRLIPETHEKLSAILAYNGQQGYDILKFGRLPGDKVQIMVTAENLEAFENFLNENEIDNMIVTENVQEAVEEEAARQRSASISRSDASFSFDAYHRYDTMVNHMRELAATYSDIVTLIELGTSFEERIIYGVKISSGGTGKPAVLIDGGIHAREWIASAVAMYAMTELVQNASNSDLIDMVDWYIFPVLNPDGYEYTHTNYRLWRKTRSVNAGSSCFGADPNRNFGFHWMLNGASQYPCDDIYAGTEAFSEPETAALRDFVLANKDTIKLYLTLHSFGECILYPWGFTSDLPDDEPELRALAEAADDALFTVRGTRYTIGSSTNVLYAAAGGSDDWVKGVAGIELSYTWELSGGGRFGFDLPASDIIVVGQEEMLAYRVMAEYVAKKFAAK